MARNAVEIRTIHAGVADPSGFSLSFAPFSLLVLVLIPLYGINQSKRQLANQTHGHGRPDNNSILDFLQ